MQQTPELIARAGLVVLSVLQILSPKVGAARQEFRVAVPRAALARMVTHGCAPKAAAAADRIMQVQARLVAPAESPVAGVGAEVVEQT